MTDRLFVPAAFVHLLATMPPVSATAWEREHWLDVAYSTVRVEFSGPHSMEAMRLARVFLTELDATRVEIEDAYLALAA
ncbi:hypothetical protein AMES_0373 [Amycolatopsis mediterranei S699]|uniref:Uncharacterized protein n=2 Tax=Amycolatopsis mediterranei TaxID=33910 RepID=A0A0H3CVX1_AMYMU|nr:hypothetical protein [Amycolatopsis mediterranei]ADJ42195.1 hypothetical protein AMED_0373 [Amycolatopsis mediterranei U32]AEK38872.1 hypothetical protein RAM_01900 [Amycolatopsis mediterranei S699]AFO73909.1 hypothetical protein AMES_0373 [Amycolatopsis mediterranei S699]AGT81038.1 hypothetical protein B737_0374 [Amycolatopsis mediterranei RB]KDO12843.1 hypothetical protein DV26_00015 [Amycolatopsis mediterranei]